MKLVEEINTLKKEDIFSYYTCIVDELKEYEKITRKQMIKEIYQLYNSNCNNIIDICSNYQLFP